MNVNDVDYVVPSHLKDESSVQAWLHLLSLRATTFQGFCEVEVTKGLLEFPTSLSLARGQDVVRMFTTRAIEELMEAFASTERTHYLEELIDCLNYLMGLLFLEGKLAPGMAENIARALHQASHETEYWGKSHDAVPSHTLWHITKSLARLLEKLRNRSWQHRAQDVVFTGYPELIDVVVRGVTCLLPYFNNWEEFFELFIAKDAVLQFRLRSYY